MDLELPENFPFDRPPKKGVPEQFLVDATPKEDGGRKFTINTIDGVPMGSPGKASAPGDDGEGADDAAEEAAETPDEEASEQEGGDTQATGAADEQPEPSGSMDSSQPPVSVGSAFSKKVMGG